MDDAEKRIDELNVQLSALNDISVLTKEVLQDFPYAMSSVRHVIEHCQNEARGELRRMQLWQEAEQLLAREALSGRADEFLDVVGAAIHKIKINRNAKK